MKVKHPVRWIEDRREHPARVSPRETTPTIWSYRPIVTARFWGRRRYLCRCRGLRPVADERLSGSEHGVAQSHRPLSHPSPEAQRLHRRHQQGSDGPYRGVARPGATFAIERLVDEVARELGREPFDLRRQNIVTAAELPYRTAAGMKLIPATTSLRWISRATRSICQPSANDRRPVSPTGAGLAWVRLLYGAERPWDRGIRQTQVPRGAGLRSANVRMPDGGVLIYVGVQNHGQGHETTLAQIAAHELGIDPGQISVRYGDTAIGPYGFGTFASRSIVFAGGAVGKAARAMAERSDGSGRTCFRPMSPTPVSRAEWSTARRPRSAFRRSLLRPTPGRTICRRGWIRFWKRS